MSEITYAEPGAAEPTTTSRACRTVHGPGPLPPPEAGAPQTDRA